MTDYSTWKMAELRAEFPTIKATNKRDFLRKVAEQLNVVEEGSPLGNTLGTTGTVKATLTEKEKKPDVNTYPETEGSSRRRNTKQVRNAEGKPIKSFEKGKSGAHPHELIDVQGKDGEKTSQVKEVEHKLVQRYLLSGDPLLAVVQDDKEDEAIIVVGDENTKWFKALHLKEGRATKTIRSERGMSLKNFIATVS